MERQSVDCVLPSLDYRTGVRYNELTYRTLVRYNSTGSVSRYYFMQSVILRARLESALGERIPSPFTDLDRRVFESVPTGIAPLDALTGGLPRGAHHGNFRASVFRAALPQWFRFLRKPQRHDEVCALVDGNDAFDPKSAAAAGLELNRLLWVRCRKLDQVLKSTDLLLQGGGFGRVVMDLTDLPLLARPIRSIGIVVPFPAHDRKNSHRPRRHESAKALSNRPLHWCCEWRCAAPNGRIDAV